MNTTTAVRALGALAQESRLAVFRLLVRHGATGLTPSAMAEELAIPAPTLSFHLKELSNAGLITAEQNGRSILYGVDFTVIRGLVEFLYENCCGVATMGCGPQSPPSGKRKGSLTKIERSNHEPISRARGRR